MGARKSNKCKWFIDNICLHGFSLAALNQTETLFCLALFSSLLFSLPTLLLTLLYVLGCLERPWGDVLFLLALWIPLTRPTRTARLASSVARKDAKVWFDCFPRMSIL